MADTLLSHIRWHAERGANGFEDRQPQDAADNARMRLEAIVQLLDEVDDAAGFARVVSIIGPEVGERLKGGI